MSGVASPLRHRTMTSLDASAPRHAPTKTLVSTTMFTLMTGVTHHRVGGYIDGNQGDTLPHARDDPAVAVVEIRPEK